MHHFRHKQRDTLSMKSVRIRSFSGPYFPTFGLNMERYSEYGHFSRSDKFNEVI